MKIRKGEVTLFISPSDWTRYSKAGWKRVQDPSKEDIKRINELKKKREGGV
jgi:hypothetical protein